MPPSSNPSAALNLCLLEGGDAAWNRCFRDPPAVFTSKNGRGHVWSKDGAVTPLDGDPFHALGGLLRETPDLTGIGYWSYDLGRQVERLPQVAQDDLGAPDCWVALFPEGHPSFSPPSLDPRPSPTAATPQSTFSREGYEAAVRRVLDYIGAGDCYQVNLSQRFTGLLPDDAWSLYQRLRSGSPAPYSAFLDCGDHQVLSSSPELFLRVADGGVETRPIKGTRPRGATPEEDQRLSNELLASAKDRAELLMIVDLERNDLGRVCEYGSVHVPELHRLETYSNVHHLVATVRGRLRSGLTPLDCLRASFPGGSITGAPKIRAMEIIEDLEPVRRGAYTGAIGWVNGRGEAAWNIAIRTMVVKDGRVHFHAGGGIVADSDPAAEYEETLAKARGMMRALGVTE